MQTIKVKNIEIGKQKPLAFISGPCVIESASHTLMCAEILQKKFAKTPFSFIFKASYDKANRSSYNSFRGPGIDEGLKILQSVQKEFGLPVVADVHSPEDAAIAGNVLDMIQIPAFLCRQTDLLIAAGKTKAAINVKKGQFLAPWDMKNVVDKLISTGQKNILLTERGVSFGYNNLVSDMRSIPIMQNFGYPVCFDSSHSTQLPGAAGTQSGGQREFIPTLTFSAIAAGANAIFMESHPDPQNAKSDSATVMDFAALDALLEKAIRIYEAVHA